MSEKESLKGAEGLFITSSEGGMGWADLRGASLQTRRNGIMGTAARVCSP